MVDYASLRKKFPIKDEKRKRKSAAIKAIAREYEMKKAELGGLKAPVMKKGFVFYVVVIIGLLMLGSLVLSATGRGGKAPISRAQINVRKSVDALAIALGRYRYHVGEYPTTEEGLEILASKVVTKKGWNGPYIRQVVKDPWGNDYVYSYDGNSKTPTLYSSGPDGLAGTTDDVIPDQNLFTEPFRDTSWTEGWMPHHLRGYVLAPDEHTKDLLEAEVKAVITNSLANKKELMPISSDVLSDAIEKQLEKFVASKNNSQWGNGESKIRFLSHWNCEAKDGEKVSVRCETECDEAELYLNGETCGRKKRLGSSSILEWNISYDPGELKVIAFNNGSVAGEAILRTAEKAISLKMTCEKKSLSVGELAFIKVEAVDQYETIHPTISAKLSFSLEGPGEILASRDMTNGCGVVVVRRKQGSNVPLKVKSSASSLRSATIDFNF